MSHAFIFLLFSFPLLAASPKDTLEPKLMTSKEFKKRFERKLHKEKTLSKLYLGRDKTDGSTLFFKKDSSKEKGCTKAEIEAALRLQQGEGCPYLMELKAYTVPEESSFLCIPRKTGYYRAAFERIHGMDLFKKVTSRSIIPMKKLQQIFAQIFLAVLYMHHLQVAHIDISLDNVMVAKNGNVKLVDFGLAKIVDENGLFESSSGKPDYVPPEIGKMTSAYKWDSFTLGVTLGSAFLRHGMFSGVFSKRKAEVAWFLKNLGDYLGDAKTLVAGLLNVNVDERLSVAQAIKHPWLWPAVQRDKWFKKVRNDEWMVAMLAAAD